MVPIAPASKESSLEALHMVFRDLAWESRLAYAEALYGGIRRGSIPREGLLEARREGRLVGAMFVQVQPGRTAIVWPPRRLPDEPRETSVELLNSAARWMVDQGVRAANALLPEVSEEDDGVLRAAGYERLADLVYLASEADALPAEEPSGPLEYEPYGRHNHARLVRLIEATYVDSLDCPQLTGVRETEDVLAGYAASGSFSPERWLLVRHRGEDVGCLLLTEHAPEGFWELIYMGLVPAARGKGWGVQIARHAQWRTRQAGRSRLVVAVDAANRPGLAMYLSAGFFRWDQRTVYWRAME